MKRFAILASIVAAGLGAAALNAQGMPGIGPTEKVTDNVYKIFGAGGNTTFFIRSDGVVLVDTKVGNQGAAILAEVRKVTDKPVTMIINTHSHPDHMGSNAEIASARGSVQIVAHANTAARINAMPNTPDVNQTFQDTLTLGSGNDRINLYWFGAAHTDGDAFITFPTERVLLMGDAMAWDMGPLIDPGSGGSMVATPVTIGRVVSTITGIDRVVEGHGHVIPWSTLQRYHAYTQKVVDVARRANAENLDYVQAYDRYFATDPAMAPYTSEQIKPGLEYGGTPKSRTYNNLYVAMIELRGERPPLIMGAPPRPGEPLPAPRGPGGPGGGPGGPGGGPGGPGGGPGGPGGGARTGERG